MNRLFAIRMLGMVECAVKLLNLPRSVYMLLEQEAGTQSRKMQRQNPGSLHYEFSFRR